jgi:hypothetical protein
VPLSLSGLVDAMLDPDPARRPSAAEVARRTNVVDAGVPAQPVVATAVLPVPPMPTTTLPVAAAETTDLAVPEPRRAAALVAVLGLVLLAVLVPTVTSAGPSPLRRVTASIVAANKANAAAVAKQRAANHNAAQGQDAATTKPVKKAKPKPKVKLTGRGPGGPGSVIGGPGGGPGHGHGGGHGHGDGDGGPGNNGDD